MLSILRCYPKTSSLGQFCGNLEMAGRLRTASYVCSHRCLEEHGRFQRELFAATSCSRGRAATRVPDVYRRPQLFVEFQVAGKANQCFNIK